MTYDVIDLWKGTTVLKDASPCTICKYIGVKRIPISNYANMRTAYRSRYRFEFSKENETRPKPTTFREEWLQMQKLFKNVKWAKEWEPGVYVVNERD